MVQYLIKSLTGNKFLATLVSHPKHSVFPAGQTGYNSGGRAGWHPLRTRPVKHMILLQL